MFHPMSAVHPSNIPGAVTALHVANGLINMCQIEKNKQYASYLNLSYLQKLGLVNQLDDWTTLANGLLCNAN